MNNLQGIPSNLTWLIVLVALWTLPWKGVALWRAAKRHDLWWFIILLFVNSLALLEILYIFIWNKRKPKTANG